MPPLGPEDVMRRFAAAVREFASEIKILALYAIGRSLT